MRCRCDRTAFSVMPSSAATSGEVGRTRSQLGPLVAFAAAASGLELLGLGPIFWALVLGVATAFVLDRRSAP